MTGRPHHQVPPRWWEVALAWCPPDDSPLLGGPVGSPGKVVGVIRATRSEQNEVTRRYDRAAPIYDLLWIAALGALTVIVFRRVADPKRA